LRGLVVVELWTNRVERVQPGVELHSAVGVFEVLHSSRVGPAGVWTRWLISFRGVEARETAEALRDVVLLAAPLPDVDALWVHELIGSEVVDPSGRSIGFIDSVEANPASDLLVLADGTLIPLSFVTDRRPGQVTVDTPPGLLEP
jgi:16S rRNA processing protein RimM